MLEELELFVLNHSLSDSTGVGRNGSTVQCPGQFGGMDASSQNHAQLAHETTILRRLVAVLPNGIWAIHLLVARPVRASQGVLRKPALA